MRKTSKDAAFALKTFFPRAPDQRSVQQLDGDFALETPVAAPCEPHGAHAALAQRRFQRVRADRLTDQRRLLCKGGERTVRQKAFALERVLLFQKCFELRGERFVFAAQLFKPRRTLADVEVERSIEQRTQSPPAVVVEHHRGYASGKSLLSA